MAANAKVTRGMDGKSIGNKCSDFDHLHLALVLIIVIKGILSIYQGKEPIQPSSLFSNCSFYHEEIRGLGRKAFSTAIKVYQQNLNVKCLKYSFKYYSSAQSYGKGNNN